MFAFQKVGINVSFWECVMIIKRDYYLNQLITSQHNGIIKIITGLRRSGKSYLLFHLFNDYLREQGINDDHIIKVDLEDRRIAPLRNPDTLLSYYIQSAFVMPTDAKERQESASLLNIGDSFKKIIIVKDHIKPKRNEERIVTIGVIEIRPRL